MAKYRILALTLLAIGIGHFKAAEKTVTPGRLATVVSNLDTSDPVLKIKGEIDARDFDILKALPSFVTTLDMSEIKVKECNLAAKDESGRSSYAEGELPAYLFFKSGLKTISLPSNTNIIGEGMFASSAIETIVIPSGCEIVMPYAFYDCDFLEALSFPETVKKIGEKSMAECEKLVSVTLPANAILDGAEIFSGSAVRELDTSKIAEYGDYSLASTNGVRQVSLNPSGKYGDGVLMASGELQQVSGAPVEIPSLFTAVSPRLDVNNLVKVASVINDYAFADTEVSDIIFSKDLVWVGKGSFANCKSLKSIDANLMGTQTPDADPEAFFGVSPSEVTIYVAENSSEAWKNHEVWGNFNIIEGEAGINDVIADNKISIFVRGSEIIISSPYEIGHYAVYNMNGISVASGATLQQELSLSSDGWNEKIVVVKVWNNNGAKDSVVMLP